MRDPYFSCALFASIRARVFFVLLYACGVVSSWALCPVMCSCKWKSGKQSVECSDKGLIVIPEGIDQETQLLDMSDNNLQVLPKETFVRAALLDLQKVYLRNCSIGQIDDRALLGLSNVVDLDLSRNLLTSVPSSIFEDVRNLRNLSLAHNPIQKIDASAFRHVTSLTKLDLSHCRIAVIATRAFEGIEFLELLRLNNNRLRELKLATIDALSGLHGIELHDNPWYCDCGLRSLKIWLAEKHVPYTIEPTCGDGPSRVQDKPFNQLHADDFACRPEMKTKPDLRYVESTAGDNATVLCKVESVPRANISWYWNGRLLLNNTAFSPYQRIIIVESGDTERKSVLTLTNAQESDSSQFYCVAENQAGVAEANFTLRVVHRLSAFAILGNGHMAFVSLALIVLICSILVMIVYLLFRIRKMPGGVRELKHAAGGDDLANGGVHAHRVDAKTLTAEPSLDIRKTSYSTSVAPNAYPRVEAQTLPRLAATGGGGGGISYATAFDDDQSLDGAIARRAYRAETSNPDLIADTRYQEAAAEAAQKAGEYTRASDLFYPSSLWNQNEIQKLYRGSGGASDFCDANDKTPIIEKVSFGDGHCHPRSKDCYEYAATPTAAAAATASSPAESPGATATSALGHPNAKTIRVWQKGVQVLPPVTALKRVLNRNSPDEGYQEGCGTDV